MGGLGGGWCLFFGIHPAVGSSKEPKIDILFIHSSTEFSISVRCVKAWLGSKFGVSSNRLLTTLGWSLYVCTYWLLYVVDRPRD